MEDLHPAGALARLPLELVLGILAMSTPSSAIAAVNTELVDAVRSDMQLALAWTHHILAASDASVMDQVPVGCWAAGWWATAAAMDRSEYPDTRGLPTPATWLMKRLVHGLLEREAQLSDDPSIGANPIELAPSPFLVPAVVDFMLQPRRFRSVAAAPLDEVMRAWDVPYVPVPDNPYSWTFDAPEPLAAKLAAPRLRPIPEALQLPGLYLHTSEYERFKDVTRRLLVVLPTLSTAKAPVGLWMRLGIDDRNGTRRTLSAVRISDDWGIELKTQLITLPTYWAVLAAAEGRVDVMDHLVAELGVDPQALTAFLSYEKATSFVLDSLTQFSTQDRVMPTWHWLVANGYAYPEHDSGPLATAVSSSAAEYSTVRALFLTHDQPRILAIADVAERATRYQELVEAFWGWTDKGHVDLLPVFAELRILTPSNLYSYVSRVPAAENSQSVLELLCPHVEGGMLAAIEFGLDIQRVEVRDAIQLAHRLYSPEIFSELICKRYGRPEFVKALVTVKGVQADVDHQALAGAVIARFANNEVTDGEAIEAATTVGRWSNIGKLILRALCVDGTSAWAAINALSPAQRLCMFGYFTGHLPMLDYDDATEESAPTLAEGVAPVGWPAWQWVLDRMLPAALDSPAELAASSLARDLVARGARAWQQRRRRSSPTVLDSTSTGDLWTAAADLPTAAAVVALPIDTNRHAELLPLWAMARLCLLAPAAVLPFAVFSAQTPTWLWQMRLDVLNRSAAVSPSVPDGWQPPRLRNWIMIVGAAMTNNVPWLATTALVIAYQEEQRMVGDPSASSVNYADQLRGMSKKWPAVLDLAREVGFTGV